MAEASPRVDAAKLAVQLAVALTRVRSRLREEAGAGKTGLTISQLAVLQRVIDSGGSATASSLAAAEHVSQQAVAQTLVTLKARGLIVSQPDPDDRRKSLLDATVDGRYMSASLLEAREAWLARAIDVVLTPDERGGLETVIELLERLADADLRTGVEIR